MMHDSLQYFEAAQMASPWWVRRNPLTPVRVEELCRPLIGKLVSCALMNSMIDELSDYTTLCANIDWTSLSPKKCFEPLKEFWRKNKSLAASREFFALCLPLQPSSACVERAFSLLKYIFDDLQGRNLRDKIELALKLRYNRAKDIHTKVEDLELLWEAAAREDAN